MKSFNDIITQLQSLCGSNESIEFTTPTSIIFTYNCIEAESKGGHSLGIALCKRDFGSYPVPAIHIYNPSIDELEHCISDAIKDGFKDILVYGLADDYNYGVTHE